MHRHKLKIINKGKSYHITIEPLPNIRPMYFWFWYEYLCLPLMFFLHTLKLTEACSHYKLKLQCHNTDLYKKDNTVT